jgi:peptide/nickel transport system ATP-binding protein
MADLPASSPGRLLDVVDLRTHFFTDDGVVHAVDGVGFTIDRGRTLGVVGESGCGKSITARSILNMIRPPGRIVSGQIRYHRYRDGEPETVDITGLDPTGDEIRRIRWREIAMIFQEPMTSLSPVHTVGNQMMEAIVLHLAMTKDEARDRSIELLAKVGLPNPVELMGRYRHQLSGGMRQRVMIAMALTCDPSLLIADEPTTALDVTTQAQILELLGQLQDELGMAIMFITHDLGVVAEMADDVLVMYLGREVERADVDSIYHNPIHPYSRALLESIPRPGRGRTRLATIAGAVPDPRNIPPGCAFHPRCPRFDPELCSSPELIEVDPGHWARCTRVGDHRLVDDTGAA